MVNKIENKQTFREKMEKCSKMNEGKKKHTEKKQLKDIKKTTSKRNAKPLTEKKTRGRSKYFNPYTIYYCTPYTPISPPVIFCNFYNLCNCKFISNVNVFEIEKKVDEKTPEMFDEKFYPLEDDELNDELTKYLMNMSEIKGKVKGIELSNEYVCPKGTNGYEKSKIYTFSGIKILIGNDEY